MAGAKIQEFKNVSYTDQLKITGLVPGLYNVVFVDNVSVSKQTLKVIIVN